jgi:hypothetical protein
VAPVTLSAPVLIAPTDGATDQPLSVILQWTDTNTTFQEMDCQIRIKPAGGVYTIVITLKNVISYLKKGLVKNKTYYWNVRAKEMLIPGSVHQGRRPVFSIQFISLVGVKEKRSHTRSVAAPISPERRGSSDGNSRLPPSRRAGLAALARRPAARRTPARAGAPARFGPDLKSTPWLS